MGDDSKGVQPSTPRLVTADPRKFSEYALNPDHAAGKDGIFVEQLGFRVRSSDDARILAALYVEQATLAIAAGHYTLGRQDRYGLRYVVPIELGGRLLRSVWILRSDGILALVTPFSGFVDKTRRGGTDD